MLKTACVVLCLGCGMVASRMTVDIAPPVDLELLLAVDVSRSMDVGELALQRAGYAAALRDAAFLDALRSGTHGRIALGYYEWAGKVHDSTVVAWRIVDGPESADAFAAEIESRPEGASLGTSISTALVFGAALFDGRQSDAARRVIDISGDGPNNTGKPVTAARDAVLARDIVINGLPIMVSRSRSFDGLDRYFAECVIGGPGSFVLPVGDVSEFATAIRRKLVLEVSGRTPPASVKRAAVEPPIDCLKGEHDARLQ